MEFGHLLQIPPTQRPCENSRNTPNFSWGLEFGHFLLQIPPTQLVDCSYPAYTSDCTRLFPNPNNAVGGSFILSLLRCE